VGEAGQFGDPLERQVGLGQELDAGRSWTAILGVGIVLRFE
jgi:hypothetical protein